MSVVHKNPFDLLGNDGADADAAPVRTVDKNSTRTAKRNTDGEAPSLKGGAANPARRAGYTGNEAAFRDRGAGSDRNRFKSTDDGTRGPPRGGHNARVRGGRGSRFPRERDDRHYKGPPGGGSEKQANQGWGGTEGEAEMKDEQAGEEIAKKDEKEAAAEDAEGDAKDDTPAEPEDKSVSYAEYEAQLAEKKAALEAENALKVRKANEGSKQNKQWAAAKPLVKDDDDEFISGSGGKAKRERERKVKQLVEIDNRYVEPDRPRGGRGGGRGASGRGDSRGGPRGGGGGGGRGGARGDYRGGRGGGGDRGGGDHRGGRGGSQNLNTNDETAFPSLGS